MTNNDARVLGSLTATRRSAGYTHRISWLEYVDSLEIYVRKSFPTTADAVDLHLTSLNRRKAKCESVGEENIKNIRCEILE